MFTPELKILNLIVFAADFFFHSFLIYLIFLPSQWMIICCNVRWKRSRRAAKSSVTAGCFVGKILNWSTFFCCVVVVIVIVYVIIKMRCVIVLCIVLDLFSEFKWNEKELAGGWFYFKDSQMVCLIYFDFFLNVNNQPGDSNSLFIVGKFLAHPKFKYHSRNVYILWKIHFPTHIDNNIPYHFHLYFNSRTHTT